MPVQRGDLSVDYGRPDYIGVYLGGYIFDPVCSLTTRAKTTCREAEARGSVPSYVLMSPMHVAIAPSRIPGLSIGGYEVFAASQIQVYRGYPQSSEHVLRVGVLWPLFL